jgi:peptidoglycan-N-acetylglucosamine deacetylase
MGLIRQCVKSVFNACLPRHRWLTRGSSRAWRDRPTCSLTFDDGPHPDHTPRVLAALKRWGLTGTFFVVGREAVRSPALLQQIVDEGHELANHSFFHIEPRSISAQKLVQEFRDTETLLSHFRSRRGADGRTALPVLFRPPKGEVTWSKLRALWKQNATIVLWTLDPKDYRLKEAADVKAWVDQHQPQHGDIVLLHDNQPAAADIVQQWGEAGVWDRMRTVPVSTWLLGSHTATNSHVQPPRDTAWRSEAMTETARLSDPSESAARSRPREGMPQ